MMTPSPAHTGALRQRQPSILPYAKRRLHLKSRTGKELPTQMAVPSNKKDDLSRRIMGVAKSWLSGNVLKLLQSAREQKQTVLGEGQSWQEATGNQCIYCVCN
eukprot:1146346-Pelagomonas_calceolata.AAC.3